ncbi:hypothetical protein [Mycolicibacterium holsaticum]|uniref:Uncharacterized protein n=1 Tax=Mycolicibacterium holsaticum TaxID=152142 RepID=A0A1E3S339_9MYCO|nr:hypothetical protein [Mycolicibacterium holsaticum]ODQ96092.1 hypothetical protein BHQ17_02335 [Mycolicibacterium holsaticum]
MTVRCVAIAAGLAGLALAAAPVAVAQPAPDLNVKDIRDYPVAQGRYSSPGDFYYVFFKTPDGLSCGIGPNGGPVGCDAAPSDAPPGTNQTVVNSWAPAQYRHSDIATFTRDVDVLPVGHRLENWGASCAVEDVGLVRCETYNAHGFILATNYGELW